MSKEIIPRDLSRERTSHGAYRKVSSRSVRRVIAWINFRRMAATAWPWTTPCSTLFRSLSSLHFRLFEQAFPRERDTTAPFVSKDQPTEINGNSLGHFAHRRKMSGRFFSGTLTLKSLRHFLNNAASVNNFQRLQSQLPYRTESQLP